MHRSERACTAPETHFLFTLVGTGLAPGTTMVTSKPLGFVYLALVIPFSLSLGQGPVDHQVVKGLKVMDCKLLLFPSALPRQP